MATTRQADTSHHPDDKQRPALAVGPGDTWGGQDLKRVVAAASVWLARNAEMVNSLNVFPVPDGDTGTNMALTMQSAIKQIEGSPSHSASQIANGLSRGSLMGARGNSGVILSQVWRGFAEGLAGKERISASDFADGLKVATATAYRAVLKPVEGTILTVVKDAGDSASRAASKVNSFSYMLAETAKAAKASVARTPLLLDKLRDAGVVDAGGEGLYLLLDGMRRYAEGEDLQALNVAASGPAAALQAAQAHVEHGEYGYCTNFLLVGGPWNFDEVRARIAALGDSAVVVGDDELVKVHIHTDAPGTVLNYACKLGSLRQIAITNMQDQHEEFLLSHAEERAPGAIGAVSPHMRGARPVAESRIAIVPVVSGEGLVRAFRSMGATAFIEGGQTMNPSTEQMLKVIESVPQNEVLLLPNNGNIVMAARQTTQLTRKRVVVVPTETIPQGMAALIAFNYEASLAENAQDMAEVASQVQTAEITRAVRDAKVNGFQVKEGDIIGLINNTLVTTGPTREEVAWDLLGRMEAQNREIITIYRGQDLPQDEAQSFTEKARERYPDAQIELVDGGQPFYDYIISAE